MNTLAVHALLWLRGTSEHDWRRTIACASGAGFDLLEIPVRDPASVDAGLVRRLLAAHHLRPVCLLGLPFDGDVSSADPATVARGEGLLLDALRATTALGATYLGGVVYSAAGSYDRAPTATGRRASADVLRRLAEHAAAAGVTIGLEVVNRYETNLLNTAEQALEMIDLIGAGNVVVHLDTYHMNIEEADMAAAVRACGPRLGYVHASESNRGPLGQGSVDFPAVFGALAGIDYGGPIGFESFTASAVPPAFAASMGLWRELWDDPDAVARQARYFITAGMSIARRGAERQRVYR